MADQSAAVSGYGALVYHPGNPNFPTLPGVNDPSVGKLDEFGLGAQKGEFIDPQLPVTPAGGQGAAKTGGYAGWYLDQIWVTPAPIDFGDISEQKDVPITLYNTYRNPRTLNSVDIPVAGLTLDSPTLPATLESFGDEILTFRAAASGPQDFDDDITFNVDLVSFDVRTLGRRVVILLGVPQVGATEQLNFRTNLMRTKDGKEQAFSLRTAPRATVRYRFRLDSMLDAKRAELQALLMGAAPILPIGIQYWWEARQLTSAAVSTDTIINFPTSTMNLFDGDTVVFTKPDDTNVVATVQQVNSPDTSVTLQDEIGQALPIGTYATPVRYGHLQGDVRISTSRLNMEDLDVTIFTEGEQDISEVDPNYFDFYSDVESPARPILRERCTRNRLSGTISREQQVIDSETGRAFVTGTEPLGQQSSQAVVFIESDEQLFAWRKFLHFVRGSWGTFYAPTFQNDLPLNEAFALGGNTFTIPEMGIAKFFNAAAPKRDLRIRTADGTVYYRRITSVVSNGNGTETVTVNAVVGSSGSSPIATTFISWMHLVRILGDTASFTHLRLGRAELTFQVRTTKE